MLVVSETQCSETEKPLRGVNQAKTFGSTLLRTTVGGQAVSLLAERSVQPWLASEGAFPLVLVRPLCSVCVDRFAATAFIYCVDGRIAWK